jgi:mannosyltransferase
MDAHEHTDEVPRRAAKIAPRAGFFNRRVRLTGDSSFTVPLPLVLLFPCLVVIVILTLFARSPDSNDLMNMPAGTPMSIRYVGEVTLVQLLETDNAAERLARSTTSHSL